MAEKTWLGDNTGNVGDWGVAANWSPSGVPVAADNVRIPAGSEKISGTLDQSAVALGDVIVEDGYTNPIGTRTAPADPTYLQIDPNAFSFEGTGVSYIDTGATGSINPEIYKTAVAGAGLRGLYLKGTNFSVVSIVSGDVSIAGFHGESATVPTLRLLGGSCWLGDGLTLTTLDVYDGNHVLRAAATTVNLYKGNLLTREVGAITTFNVEGGILTSDSSGTITALTINGGKVDMLQSGVARIVSTLKVNSGSFDYDPSVVTVTTHADPDDPVRVFVAGL